MVMLFTLVACGGASEDVDTEDVVNNDENNAKVQVKVDEAEVLLFELIGWYKENGFLEGENAIALNL
jgi:hypothetical protein